MGCNACNAMGVGKVTDGATGGCTVVWCTFLVGSGRLSKARVALAYVRRRGGMSYIEYQVVDIQWMRPYTSNGGRKCQSQLRLQMSIDVRSESTSSLSRWISMGLEGACVKDSSVSLFPRIINHQLLFFKKHHVSTQINLV
jgi:hypothetical protein